jgi:phosphoserine phosphatase
MRKIVFLLATLAITFSAQADPLPSWNNTGSKQAIIDFVEKVTDEASGSFVPVAHRIAVFDNDGTLWCENPVPFQASFAGAELKRRLPENPQWKDLPAVQAFMRGDAEALRADHNKGIFSILGITHAGRAPDEFEAGVSDWLAKSKHPRFDRPYNQLVYQPMLELLAYFRDNGFQTWIVSGGGQDFMRVFAEETYGIIPEHVIGSYGSVKYETKDGKPTFMKSADTVFVDDKNGKPEAIHRFIGRRPIAAFGNSDGDQAMIEYTTLENPRPSLGVIIRHTDADREYAYDANPKSSGKLVTALQAAPANGWVVVDMADDWSAVFPETKSFP